mmetsp:Transcript_28962/g.45026  ORF Transcript_28962/g.45026 Transcript_28962/m.45026 type:complete len:476 (+) Transcript_28962:92-1519(+)|eukprot:CAMPEP_0196821560 /NCGR_PEP_ID=MMETSP1362-20130617/79818_1 /TAXON_ID=163516 /ORGANISM="Leptocylindrus danicus, Strain CCMP1856" /LENGTH=475 /DNA_ID=CAMNT_0042200789 /DNA_START=72 /DNA_END=1499 /DNA_ORIENTATION=+
MIIRVRTNVGVWRITLDDNTSNPVQSILDKIRETRPNLVYTKPLSSDPGCKNELDLSAPIADYNVSHGCMLYCFVDPETCAASSVSTTADSSSGAAGSGNSAEPADTSGMKVRRTIGKDGTIKLIYEEPEEGNEKGFRKGMRALRDIKMAWTLNEFMDMDSQYVFKIKAQGEAFCKGVSLESSQCGMFQNYLRQFDFRRGRFAYLYGRFENDEEGENVKVVVDAIYEPPQEWIEAGEDGRVVGEFIPLENDPMEENVEKVAEMLNWKRVGWIFGHPPREEGFQFSSAEILMAAELQLEAADGVEKTPFVSVKVTVGEDGNASFEAFQVSLQCMEMVAEEALEIGPKPGFCAVNETFTAIMEGKESKEVENNFFLTVVPIVQHQSTVFVCQYPWANRDYGEPQSKDMMKRQLSKSGSQGWNFIDLLSDFALLLYLSAELDDTDMKKICESVVDRNIPLEPGYQIIIKSMAGIDSAY